jgi:hypothetical protein
MVSNGGDDYRANSYTKSAAAGQSEQVEGNQRGYRHGGQRQPTQPSRTETAVGERA